jgi:hypothetical protein
MFSVQMLLQKRKRAIQGLRVTGDNFDDLSELLSQETRTRWSQQEEEALNHGEGFRIYDVDIEKGVSA